TARWICRLAVSEKAKNDDAWREDYASGLQIVVQVAPQLPELSELLWLMGKSHAGTADGATPESQNDVATAESTLAERVSKEGTSVGETTAGGAAAEVAQAAVTQSGVAQSGVSEEVSAEGSLKSGTAGRDSPDGDSIDGTPAEGALPVVASNEGAAPTSATAQDSPAESVRVNPRLVDAVIAGRAVVVRHAVLAIAKSLAGNPQVMRSHLQLAKRSAGTLQLVSQVILGRLYAGIEGAELEAATGLLQTIVDLEPESGLNWFVLGVAQRNGGNLDAAEEALKRAVELLTDVAVVAELYETVSEEKERAHRPAPLNPAPLRPVR
ncbi:MAG TPA: hypothetical protein DDW52_09620, partial [Planctomycetaceae bacterium]|nr:hypothetical protein [Planctomycetaceae bacterium]